MGNIGRSSTGCALCRKRKIKCDEARPGCKRCAQIHKPCPGYPFQVQLQIRTSKEGTISDTGLNESSKLPTKPLHSLGPVVHNLGSTSHSKAKTEDDHNELALQRLTPSHRSISPPPRHDIHHQSLCFFLNLFCFQASRLYSFPVLDFLPGLIQSAEDGSCIQKAATAVSRLTLADMYSGKDVRLRTGKEYGQALSLTQATILDTKASVQDETILAVWLLGLYEMISVVLMHGRSNVDTPSIEEECKAHLLHVRGAMNLLRLRGKSQITTARGEKIFRIFKAAIQLRLFILTSVFTKDFDDMEIDVFQDEHEFVPSQTANRATGYFHIIARLLEKVKLFLARRPELPEKTNAHSEMLSRYGQKLDDDMIGWSKDEPGWDMMPIRAPKTGTTWALYPSHAMYYFYSSWVYLYWLRFLAARFKLYEALIELLKLDRARATIHSHPLPGDFDLRMAKHRELLQQTASELIGLTAYALGDVTPTGHFVSSVSGHNTKAAFQEINVVATMQLVLPLKMLSRSEYLEATQKGAVDLAISHIGDGFRRQPLMVL